MSSLFEHIQKVSEMSYAETLAAYYTTPFYHKLKNKSTNGK